MRAPELRAGDVLVIAPGDLVPVDAELLERGRRFSTDWITGEPDARAVRRRGSRCRPAPSTRPGRAVHVRALTDFPDSPLVALLRQAPDRAPARVPAHARFWNACLAPVGALAVLADLPRWGSPSGGPRGRTTRARRWPWRCSS